MLECDERSLNVQPVVSLHQSDRVKTIQMEPFVVSNSTSEPEEGQLNSSKRLSTSAISLLNCEMLTESQPRDMTEVLEESIRYIPKDTVSSTTSDSDEASPTSSPTSTDVKTYATIDEIIAKPNGTEESQDCSIQNVRNGLECQITLSDQTANGLEEICTNSYYSTSSSSLPGHGSDQRESPSISPVRQLETDQLVTTATTSASILGQSEVNLPETQSASPTTTVTVSTCPSCGSESVGRQCLRSSWRYSSESCRPMNPNKAKWKAYRPEATRSSYRCSPYRVIKPSPVKISRHRSDRVRCSLKKDSFHDIGLRSTKGKKRVRSYCSKGLGRVISTASAVTPNRCHLCQHEANGFTGLLRSKGDCPYSLTYDDDHMMSHLCDIDSWHRRRKRETLKKKERAIIIILSIIAILIFIAMSYFGTILFLRITTLPTP